VRKRTLTKKLVLNRETLTRLALREVGGASVQLSCDGQRCSNDSVCYYNQGGPLCQADSAPVC
jgi:hypothetical protein